MITVEVGRKVDAEAWNARVRELPGGSIFQTTYWASYFAAYLGAKPHYLVFRKGGEVIGQLLILEMLRGHESFLRGVKASLGRLIAPLLRVFAWREGPLISEPGQRDEVLLACLQTVEDLALERGVTGLEDVFLPVAESYDPPEISGFLRHGYHMQQRATIRIDVRRPLDLLWANLKKDVARTPIRKAQRQGLKFREVGSPSEVEEFYQLVRSWRRDHSLAPYTFAKYDKMFEYMNPHCSFFIADYSDRAVGGSGLWHFNGRAYLFTPVQSALACEHRIYAGDFLYWEMIRWCHDRGFEVLDLSGISFSPASQKEGGIRRFKEKWGGRVVEYPIFTRPLKQFLWKGADLLRYARHRAAKVFIKTE